MNAADRRVLQTLLGTALAVVVLSSGLVFAQGWPFRPSSGGGLTSAAADAAYIRLDGTNADPAELAAGASLWVAPAGSPASDGVVTGIGIGRLAASASNTTQMRITGDGAFYLDTGSSADDIHLAGERVCVPASVDGNRLTMDLGCDVELDAINGHVTVPGDGAAGLLFNGCSTCSISETSAEEIEVSGQWVSLDGTNGIRFRDGGIMLTYAETGVNEVTATYSGDGSTGAYSSVVTHIVPAVDPSDYIFRWYENGLQVLALDGGGQLLATKIGAAGSEVSTLYVDQLSNSTGIVVTDGRHVVSQLDLSGKGDYISTTPTALPTCDASTEGILIYVNDTNDSKHAQTCICGQLSGTVDVTLAWNPIGPGAGACPP